MKCVGIQVVGMVVGRGCHGDALKPGRVDDPLDHAYVRLVAVCVFCGQGIGKVGVQEKAATLPLDKEPALAHPPEVELVDLGDCVLI